MEGVDLGENLRDFRGGVGVFVRNLSLATTTDGVNTGIVHVLNQLLAGKVVNVVQPLAYALFRPASLHRRQPGKAVPKSLARDFRTHQVGVYVEYHR